MSIGIDLNSSERNNKTWYVPEELYSALSGSRNTQVALDEALIRGRVLDKRRYWKPLQTPLEPLRRRLPSKGF